MEASEKFQTAHTPASDRVMAGVSRVALITLALFVLALAPRGWGLGDYVTIDEASKWFGRSERFLIALQEGNYVDTNQTGHPGVTTMWLGSAGVLMHQFFVGLGWIAPDDLTSYRALLRLPVAIITALSVALAYLLMRRLLDERVALLAAILWATEPLLVAHGQVLHLDGLLTSFMLLSLLTALFAFRFDERGGLKTAPRRIRSAPRWGFLVASALAAGLALLTKSPSVLLLPMVGLIALVGMWRHKILRLYMGYIGRLVLALLVWVGVATLTWFALWPATWVDPSGAITSVVNEVIDNGAEPHNVGNFFLGQAIADPGPLFYPVAIALRLTPWTLVGLLLAVVALAWQARVRLVAHRPPTADRQPLTGVGSRWSVGLLICFALFFTVVMTSAPKKFDRYVLPIFPVLDIISAVGFIWALDQLRHRIFNGSHPKSKIQNLKLPGFLVVALLALNIAWYHPYIFAYYNPLLGGGPVAARIVPVGWGEGYEQAGAFISAQVNGCDRPVASWFGPVLQHFVCTRVVPMSELSVPGEVVYAVLYIDQLQRNNEPQAIDMLYGKVPPVHTVRIHGIDYAYVYQIAPPVARPLAADFGAAIHLRGYDVDTSAVRSSGVLTLTLDWHSRAPMDTDYNLFVHVLSAEGTLVGQVDVPPGGPGKPTSAWQPDRYVTLTQVVSVPADIPAGDYWIAIGIYDPQDFARLPLRGDSPPGAPYDGPDALRLGPMPVP